MKNNNELIIKSNTLIEGLTDMKTIQYKFTLYLISLINKDDKEFKKVSIPTVKYAELLDIDSSHVYRYMKTFEKELLKKIISIELPNGRRTNISWFTRTDYIPKKGVLEITFNPELCPYLLRLDKAFTQFLFSNIKKMKSFFSIRLYELLKKEQYKCDDITIDLVSLRDILQLKPKEYALYGDLNRRILKPCEKEINDQTDIFISNRKEIKSGKKVTALQYTIINNDNFKSNQKLQYKVDNKKSINKKTGIEQRQYSDEFYESLYEIGGLEFPSK